MNTLGKIAAFVLIFLSWLGVAVADEQPAPFSARSGLEVAKDAARSWAEDARLVYLENDEAVLPDGNASRWGYLFHSESRGKARGYSIRGGKLDEAADLGFDLDAPPVADEWIDSGAARSVAEKAAGTKYCLENNGHLSTMLLIRGAFHDRTPNATTWALVYTAPHAPSLYVVVDAARGEVVRTWRG